MTKKIKLIKLIGNELQCRILDNNTRQVFNKLNISHV